jgi:hypothetical protein
MRALAYREKKLNPSFHGRAFCHNFEGLHGLSRIPAALAGNPRTGAPKEEKKKVFRGWAVPRSRRLQQCLQTRRSDTAQGALAGYARLYWRERWHPFNIESDREFPSATLQG